MKADASLWLAQKEAGLLDESQVEEEPAPLVPTLQSYADDWMATRTLRPGTQAIYRSQLRRHLLPTFGDTQIDAISPAEVRRWYAGRIETGLSAVTVAKQYRLLRAILSTAVDDGLIPTNHLCHLAGTLTAQAGATLREIMDRLGHSSPQAAMRYQHVALERNERIARAIDDLLDAEDHDPDDEPEARG